MLILSISYVDNTIYLWGSLFRSQSKFTSKQETILIQRSRYSYFSSECKCKKYSLCTTVIVVYVAKITIIISKLLKLNLYWITSQVIILQSQSTTDTMSFFTCCIHLILFSLYIVYLWLQLSRNIQSNENENIVVSVLSECWRWAGLAT